MSEDVLHERAPEAATEYGPFAHSLHARWAVQLGHTIYNRLATHHGKVPLEQPLPYGVKIKPDGDELIVVLRQSDLQDTRKDGALVTSITTSVRFAHGSFSGMLVQFYVPGNGGTKKLLTETSCVAPHSLAFLDRMTALPPSQQKDIATGLVTLGTRLGIDLELLKPAAHLQEELRARQERTAAQVAIHVATEPAVLESPEPSAA